MARNESLLIAASYFWSDALNAFLFGHGPMTPTLADVLMLTGLDISHSDTTFSRRADRLSHRLETKDVSGWKGYVVHHSRTDSITPREHVAFLTMWLEKFVFCGKTAGPTSNFQPIAELLDAGTHIPLGKHLLGSVYNLLHQVAIRLSVGKPIGSLGGPWWFINMWLNLHLRTILEENITAMTFPKDQLEDEALETRRCTSFGEAVSMFSGSKQTPSEVADFFRSFYYGLQEESTIWFAYKDEDFIFELPTFKFSTATSDDEDKALFEEIIKPGILPANFFGKSQSPTYM